MSFILALIGTRATGADDVEDVVDFHLDHPAFWSGTKHSRWAKGSRVVAKVAGARVLALSGTLDCLAPAYDPLVRDDQVWDWRYDVRWDTRPSRPVPVGVLGPPFDRPIRAAQSISLRDFERAYRALHQTDPPRQDRE